MKSKKLMDKDSVDWARIDVQKIESPAFRDLAKRIQRVNSDAQKQTMDSPANWGDWRDGKWKQWREAK